MYSYSSLDTLVKYYPSLSIPLSFFLFHLIINHLTITLLIIIRNASYLLIYTLSAIHNQPITFGRERKRERYIGMAIHRLKIIYDFLLMSRRRSTTYLS